MDDFYVRFFCITNAIYGVGLIYLFIDKYKKLKNKLKDLK